MTFQKVVFPVTRKLFCERNQFRPTKSRKPEETSRKPGETSKKPGETSRKPGETSMIKAAA